MEKKESAWLLRNLWNPGALTYARVRILDTLIPDGDTRAGFRWLFTDSHGEVRKHGNAHVSTEQIINTFISKSLASSGFSPEVKAEILSQRPRDRQPDDLIIATLISGDNYETMGRQKTISLISQRNVGSNAAVQLFLYPYKDVNIRYRLTSKFTDGRLLYIEERVWVEKTGIRSERITSEEISKKMQSADKEVRIVVERSSGMRVVELSLLFLMDKTRTIWLVGSTTCILSSADQFYSALSTPKSMSPQQSVLSHNLHSTASVASLSRHLLTHTQASLGHFSPHFPQHKSIQSDLRCPGDFCNFVLSELAQLQRKEADFEDFLKVINSAYSSDGLQGALNLKLSIAAEFLSHQRSKLRAKRVTNVIPNRYLILGRKLLSMSGWRAGFSPHEDLEIDLRPLLKHRGRLYLPDSEINAVERAGQSQPLEYYSDVKVCDRCYAVYRFIKVAHQCAQRRTVQSVHTSPSASRLKRSGALTVKTVDSDCFTTSLGKINKNNLNDLLLDLRYSQEEDQLKSPEARAKLNALYRDLTEEETKKKVELRKKEEKEKAEMIETKRVEDFRLEKDLAIRFLPEESAKKLQVIDPASKNTAKWRQFIEKRRHVRAKTSDK